MCWLRQSAIGVVPVCRVSRDKQRTQSCSATQARKKRQVFPVWAAKGRERNAEMSGVHRKGSSGSATKENRQLAQV